MDIVATHNLNIVLIVLNYFSSNLRPRNYFELALADDYFYVKWAKNRAKNNSDFVAKLKEHRLLKLRRIVAYTSIK